MGHDDRQSERDATGEARQFGCVTDGDQLLAIGQALREAVGEHLVERERTADSLRLRIGHHAGARTALEEYVRREQACCSFFDIYITEGTEDLSLTVTGPPEAAPLLDLLYQLAANSAAP